MDTKDQAGSVNPEQQSEKPARPVRASAPKMDGVSAGGRPRRPDSAGKPPTGGEKSARSRPPKAAEAKKGEPEKTARKARQSPTRKDGQSSARKAPQSEKTGEAPVRRPAPRPQRQSAQAPQRKPAAQPQKRNRRQVEGDSGYQPYRQANRKRKAQRSGSLKTFFSAQNPILKWYERIRYNKDSFAEDSDLAKQRRERRAAEAEKRRKRQNRFNTPSVIYTQPAAFNRDRLLVQLITVLTVVVALMLGLSLFFKVKVITVSGTGVYSPYTIEEASGISKGDNLLTFSRARAASQIRANLPYVKSVRIGIKLPDTVNIEIVEDDVVYAIQSDAGIWWLMNSQGKVTEMVNNAVAGNYTQVLGVTLTDPTVGQIGVATELTADQLGDETQAEGQDETQPTADTLPTVNTTVVTGAQKLTTALEILKALEDNDIVGEVASVDVSRLDDIILWYGTQYQVNLGDGNDPSHSLNYKIACMYDAILQMTDYTNGILDVSFTTWEDQVGLTPFS